MGPIAQINIGRARVASAKNAMDRRQIITEQAREVLDALRDEGTISEDEHAPNAWSNRKVLP